MANTIDPVYSSEILRPPILSQAGLDFDALVESLHGLEGKLDRDPKTAAIILAGGTGERFGRAQGKQLVEIAGKPVLTCRPSRSTRWATSGSSWWYARPTAPTST